MELPATDIDIAIVGAGAAGLMAAIWAGRTHATSRAYPSRSVIALDGAERVGAKILVSGGGRCNVTHDIIQPTDFCSSHPRQAVRVLRSFGVRQTVTFFESLGVLLKTEPGGKLFPSTDRARTVLDALLAAVADAGATILPSRRVLAISREPRRFILQTRHGELTAARVVLATGGRSLPKTGSDGQGYELARSLGHTITPTFPALVPLVLPRGHWLTNLAGITLDAAFSLAAPTGKVLHRHTGSTLITHFGLSGPGPMDFSRHWSAARLHDPEVAVRLNLLPGSSTTEVEAWLLDCVSRAPRATLASVLSQRLPHKLADALNTHAVPAPDPLVHSTLAHLDRERRRAVARALTELPLPLVGDRGWNHAEVTAGGVPLEEIDPRTMQSLRCPGLYLCGELLDIDGRIGGYNFQWAWASGRLAGIAAASA